MISNIKLIKKELKIYKTSAHCGYCNTELKKISEQSGTHKYWCKNCMQEYEVDHELNTITIEEFEGKK